MPTDPSRGDLWLVRVREEFDLSASSDELVVQAARLIDKIDTLDEVVEAAGVMSRSSQGVRVHPALVEARQSRIALHRVLTTVDLPVDEEIAA